MAGRGSVCLPAFPLTWFRLGLDSRRPEEMRMVLMLMRIRSQTIEGGDKIGGREFLTGYSSFELQSDFGFIS